MLQKDFTIKDDTTLLTNQTNIEVSRNVLAKRAALLMFVAIVFATIIRPFLVEQTVLLTYIGIVNAILAFGVFALLQYTTPRPFYPHIVIFAGLFFLLPLVLVSGGPNSQFAAVIPIVPLLVCLLTSKRVTIGITVFLIGFVILTIESFRFFPSIVEYDVESPVTYARAFWIVMACIVSAFFGIEFDRLSRKLGLKLQQQATYDSLTQIMNRGSIEEFLETMIEQKQGSNGWVSAMMIDIDNFKSINDQFGHLFGDETLKRIAYILQQSIRQQLDGIGRVGGEEFLIVLGDVDHTHSHQVAEKIRQAVETLNIEHEGKKVSITITVGYCCLPANEVSHMEALIKCADDALCMGKKNGRNTVVGSEEGLLFSGQIG
ncbi:MAG: hypothetical protein Alis3KO_32220 [Aliiglaciecola sp.]